MITWTNCKCLVNHKTHLQWNHQLNRYLKYPSVHGVCLAYCTAGSMSTMNPSTWAVSRRVSSTHYHEFYYRSTTLLVVVIVTCRHHHNSTVNSVVNTTVNSTPYRGDKGTQWHTQQELKLKATGNASPLLYPYVRFAYKRTRAHDKCT